MRRRRVVHAAVVVLVAAAALAGCSRPIDLASLTGLWVPPAGAGGAPVDGGALTLQVTFVGPPSRGCWAADGPAGVLPVRWPPGTVYGQDAVLERGPLVIADGATIDAVGVVRSGAPEDRDQLPAGCDPSAGFYDLSAVVGD